MQDAVLSVHHACIHTLAATQALKIIENHKGIAFIQQIAPQGFFMQPPQGLVPPVPLPGQSLNLNGDEPSPAAQTGDGGESETPES